MSWQVEQLKEELNAKEAQGEELKKRVTSLQTEVSAVRLTSLCAVPLTWALLAFRVAYFAYLALCGCEKRYN